MIRAVLFDAGATLVYPDPPVESEIFHRACRCLEVEAAEARPCERRPP